MRRSLVHREHDLGECVSEGTRSEVRVSKEETRTAREDGSGVGRYRGGESGGAERVDVASTLLLHVLVPRPRGS